MKLFGISVFVVLAAFHAGWSAVAADAPMQPVTQYALKVSLPKDWIKSRSDNVEKGYQFSSPEKVDYQGVPVGASVVITKAPAEGANLPQLKAEFDTLMQSSAAKVTAFLRSQNAMGNGNAKIADIAKYTSLIQGIDGQEWILAEGATVLQVGTATIPMKSLAKVTLVDGVLYSAYVAAPLQTFESQKPLLRTIYDSIALK